jgi:hypothetical protein
LQEPRAVSCDKGLKGLFLCRFNVRFFC